jgi:hypothetical protein
MSQEDHSACKLNHPEEILWVVLPANDDTSIMMKLSKQALGFPATTIVSQHAAFLSDRSAPVPAMRRDQFHMEMFANPLIRRISVARFIVDQSLLCFAQESPLERWFDEGGFIRRSADHVHGDRKTMAVCDCHDFVAFAAFCKADTRAPFFAELKLASMKDSLRSSFPRSRRSSANVCSRRSNSPERCHCWKRRGQLW